MLEQIKMKSSTGLDQLDYLLGIGSFRSQKRFQELCVFLKNIKYTIIKLQNKSLKVKNFYYINMDYRAVRTWQKFCLNDFAKYKRKFENKSNSFALFFLDGNIIFYKENTFKEICDVKEIIHYNYKDLPTHYPHQYKHFYVQNKDYSFDISKQFVNKTSRIEEIISPYKTQFINWNTTHYIKLIVNEMIRYTISNKYNHYIYADDPPKPYQHLSIYYDLYSYDLSYQEKQYLMNHGRCNYRFLLFKCGTLLEHVRDPDYMRWYVYQHNWKIQEFNKENELINTIEKKL